MSLIEAQEMVLRVSGRVTLGPYSFTIGAGDYITLTGPSGGGKSVLMETIAGFRQPDSGTLRITGANAAELPPQARGFAWVPQHHALFPHLRVRENIAFAAHADTDVRRLAEEVNVAHLLEQYPGDLSGGERQRVALARALAAKSRLLLLDEPFTAMDPELRIETQALVDRIHREHEVAVLHVTHYPDDAEGRRRWKLAPDGSLEAP